MALPDGHLVVSDPIENRVSLIDFASGTGRSLGRVGEGPREFKRATGLYRGPGGAVLVFDRELGRLLPVMPSGALQDVVFVPFGGLVSSNSPHGQDDLTFDSLGYTYSRMGRGFLTDITQFLLRQRRGTRRDTLTRLLREVTKALRVKRNGLGEYQTVLFSPQDAWVVAPDGWVAVARAAPYRVEWIPPLGPVVTGPVIRHQVIRITQEEKELIASGAAGLRGITSVGLVMVAPGGPAPPRSAAPVRMPVKDLRFAKVKTPINLREDRWPLLDERGRLWVERSLPFGIMAHIFDVFDRRGILVDRVELPGGSRLVGFDSHWIYTSRVDTDDFEHLQRFPLPRRLP